MADLESNTRAASGAAEAAAATRPCSGDSTRCIGGTSTFDGDAYERDLPPDPRLRVSPRTNRKTTRVEGITDREREVLTLVGIAGDLCISVATAKTYLTRLDARDRVQLVIVACEAGSVSVSGGRGA
jgi:hypothetical protein